MLKIRERGLPDGWYPASDREIRDLIRSWGSVRSVGNALAGIVPHAGWYFCGSMIADVLTSLHENLDTIVILGGHNPPGGPLIHYSEDAWELPSGRLFRDDELADQVESILPDGFSSLAEQTVDNTVEIIIPLIAAMHPGVKWAAWRLPADERAITFGETLAEAVLNSDRKIAVIGSTDLTHYGPNYGFMPTDSLDNPVEWMEKRDMRMLEAIVGFDGERVLELAAAEKSACSAGAALGAMTFARDLGAGIGSILSYSMSKDVHPSSSFVGYGSIIWESA